MGYTRVNPFREIPEPIQELREEMEETYRELERLRHGGELVVGEEPKKVCS